jgi:hypothetical protein
VKSVDVPLPGGINPGGGVNRGGIKSDGASNSDGTNFKLAIREVFRYLKSRPCHLSRPSRSSQYLSGTFWEVESILAVESINPQTT